MKPIERLKEYLDYYSISPSLFEKTIGLSNGYTKKQILRRGNIGSHIIILIKKHYHDLSIIWLLTGRGKMILSMFFNKQFDLTDSYEANEEQVMYLIDLEPKYIKKLLQENELLKIQINELKKINEQMQCIINNVLNLG